jgi:hypothetical protein
MRTAIMLLLLAAVAAAQTVTVEGKRVKLGTKLKSSPVFNVRVVPYVGTLGPDRVCVVAGHVTTALPSKYYKVTITIRYWYDVTVQGKRQVSEAGYTVAEIICPEPGKPTRWSALMKWGELANPAGNTSVRPTDQLRHSVAVDFDKHVPDAESTPARH